ncbi:MAG: class I SAM-dependent methyltransferase [Alphaproteobacteria bacterium]
MTGPTTAGASTANATTAGEIWAEFWSRDHSIYVNARHLAAHYQRIGRDVIALLAGRKQPRVLDYGCGDALAAPLLVDAGVELQLYDAVPAVAERLRRRFAPVASLRILSDSAFQTLPDAGLDVILMNSVAQYLSPVELGALLDRFGRLLAPGGEIVLGDIIPPDAGMAADVGSLLRSAAENGFLLAALWGLVRTVFSDYSRLRRQVGLTTYRESEIVALCADHGFKAVRAARNIGFNQSRMTIRATRGAV